MDRTKGVGGSDANKIIKGEWHDLWLIKTKRKEPDDLSDVIPVQIGIATESLNIDIFEKLSGMEVKRDVELTQKNHMMSHLDGFISKEKCVLECKHTYQNNTIEDVAKQYYAQLQHYMMHSETNKAYLSVFFGNVRHEYVYIEFDKEFADKLYIQEEKFWKLVLEDKEPTIDVDSSIIDIPEHPNLDGMTTIDMSNNIKWRDCAKQITDTKEYVEINKSAKDTLKLLVPKDCRKAMGCGFSISRNKKGSLACREMNE